MCKLWNIFGNRICKFNKNHKIFLDQNIVQKKKQDFLIKTYALKKKHVDLIKKAIEKEVKKDYNSSFKFDSEILVSFI